ncbi:DUF397 domain-containing protein [Streptodolium elevatio]|uniref:DUF397 domain-containing protein n=1 Tax=Streptodolium elevatio TaxID=3157996 RepID=A0ABV3DNX0_9ACTN
MNKHVSSSEPRWFKSTYTGPEGGNCVETAGLSDSVGVRDSKERARGYLAISPAAWSALTESIKG